MVVEFVHMKNIVVKGFGFALYSVQQAYSSPPANLSPSHQIGFLQASKSFEIPITAEMN